MDLCTWRIYNDPDTCYSKDRKNGNQRKAHQLGGYGGMFWGMIEIYQHDLANQDKYNNTNLNLYGIHAVIIH